MPILTQIGLYQTIAICFGNGNSLALGFNTKVLPDLVSSLVYPWHLTSGIYIVLLGSNKQTRYLVPHCPTLNKRLKELERTKVAKTWNETYL